ncbi:carbohydrate ABC transporter permease [Arthrobacter sp. Rue61a]|uniref:carbohydrate ABC transporter permease n=1 Tax=Arthrobacter sp. Rue61a TaxID=1118963 RepID=UPI00027DFD3A|nr:carbohydrate ABC transporter permease [Arthrobacter sp. Rue61a]AFR28755.1 putative sugar ABC transporter, permease protein [Arthrobacter sp. Rue61a]
MKTSGLWSRYGANITAYGSTLIFLLPVYVLINLAIRPTDDLTPPVIPSSRPTFENFVTAWTTSPLPGSIITSLIVTSISCLVVLVVGTMASYPLARSTSRLSSGTFYFFMIGLLLPFQLALIPLYIQMRDLGLLGTVWSLVIVYSGVQLPFTVFLITTFLRASVPLDYEEAAQIDGCSPLRAFWHVVIPLLRPALGTCIILNSVGVWNDFFTPLIYLSGSGQVTIPMAIFQFVGQYTTNWPLIFASLLISMVPVLTLYLLFQRYVIQGFAGGLKG